MSYFIVMNIYDRDLAFLIVSDSSPSYFMVMNMFDREY